MDDLDDLAKRLQGLTDLAIGDFRIVENSLAGLPSVVADTLGTVRSEHKAIDREHIAEAIAELRRGTNDLAPSILRYAVYGICRRSVIDDYCLLSDAPILKRLLDICEHEAQTNARRFRRLFGGLLNSYFEAQRDTAWFSATGAGLGHRKLREFLERHAGFVISMEPRTDWADALAQWPSLLGERPGTTFAKDWISDGGRTFSAMLAQLKLDSSSWVVADVVRSALAHAAQADDAHFHDTIPKFLGTAADPRLAAIRDEIFAGLLTRYAKRQQTAAHPALRDTVIAAWRAPWLTKNHAAWGRVSNEVRRMVESWLKLELIHQFFDVLSEDGQQDRRRFEFWRQYHESMDAVYFALGSEAHRSDNADMLKLKEALDDRMLMLLDTPAKNNAFIMRIGEKYFVEFSQSGNAAFRFSRHEFEISDGQTSLSHHKLRNGRFDLRLLHHDGWEDKFRDALASQAAEIGPAFQVISPSRVPASKSSPDADLIVEYARANGLAVEDNRGVGGNLWVVADLSNQTLNERLFVWGFLHKPGRGWWRAD
jgi:hypothetical protein